MYEYGISGYGVLCTNLESKSATNTVISFGIFEVGYRTHGDLGTILFWRSFNGD